MNTQISGDLSSNQKISDVFHAFGYSIPLSKDGRRMWPTRFKHEMLRRLEAKELSAAEISATCKMDPSTVYQWKREFRREEPKHLSTSPKQPSSFVEIKVRDNVGKRPVAPNTLTFSCRAFELRLPSDYPLDDILQIIRTLEDQS